MAEAAAAALIRVDVNSASALCRRCSYPLVALYLELP